MSQPLLPDGYLADLNLWLGRTGVTQYEARKEFTRLTRALRTVQDRVAAGRPSREVASQAADLLDAIERLLARFEVSEPEQVAGRVLDDPGRGQTLLPPLTIETWDDTRVRGRMRFSRFHLGSNGAAHGGAISLLFDDLLGQLANPPGSPRARTASIRVDFHRITPIDHDLTVAATVTRHNGRKIEIAGEVRDGARILASAYGLFVQLRDGQP